MDLTGSLSLVSKEDKLSVTKQCELLQINRTSVYYTPVEPDRERENVKHRLDYWHTKMPYLGVRKLRIKLQHKIFPYLLRNLDINRSNQVWSIDITYIRMGRSHMYLTAIIDWSSRFLIGWELSDTLDTAPVLAAVKRAIGMYGKPEIINSDQGSQFTSDSYVGYLKTENIRQSMDGKGRWVDNVIIERWFRSLKTERIYPYEYLTPRALRVGIREYIEEYNTDRPHQSHGYMTPIEVYHGKVAA